MVKLKNIAKSETQIMCDIYPEGSTLAGTLVLDTKTGDIINRTLPEGYEYCENHIAHAARALFEMSKESPMSEERIVMWY